MSSQERFADFFGERVAVVRICKYDEICGYFLVYQGTNSSTTWLQNMLIFSYLFFSWLFSRRSWAGEIGATIDSDLHLLEARKTDPSGLKEKNGVNLNILIETLNLNLISFGPIHKAGKLPTIIACSSPPRICRHLEEFRQVFKNSVHTFIDMERKHTRVLKFISRPSPFLSFGRGKGWLARNFVNPSSDIEVSPFPRANVWAPGVNHLGACGERLHLRTVVRFPFCLSCHLWSHVLQEKHRPFQPPLSPLLQKMFRKNLYNWKLYTIHLRKLQKAPRSSTWHTQLCSWLGRKCIHSMATKSVFRRWTYPLLLHR